MNDILWRVQHQTVGKHLVLEHYLSGWLPILGSSNAKLLVIDGFAGPGQYEHGERGSPLIAWDCVRRHKRAGRLRNTEVHCLFIESKKKNASHLEGLLERQRRESGMTYKVMHGHFRDQMTKFLDHVEQQDGKLVPAFVMIDPFGVKGIPIELIERILRHKKSECMISFMYEAISRFHQEPEFRQHLNELFGTTDWRECLSMEESDSKKRFLHDLFSTQLKSHGAVHVVPFELRKGNRHVYTLFFTSGSTKGCNLMKESMWKIDPSGGYAYRGYAGQMSIPLELNTDLLAKPLKEEFGDSLTPVERIEEFVMGDKTTFHKGHLRQKTLQPLERDGEITVVRPNGVRGFQSGKGIKVRFH